MCFTRETRATLDGSLISIFSDKIKDFLSGFISERDRLTDGISDMDVDEEGNHRQGPKYIVQLVRGTSSH